MSFIVLARDYELGATWRKIAFAKSFPAGISAALRQKKNLKAGTLYGVLSMDHVSAIDENLLWVGIVWKGRVVEPPDFPIYPFEMASWHRYRTSKKIIALAIDLLDRRTLTAVMLECVRLVASMTNSDFVDSNQILAWVEQWANGADASNGIQETIKTYRQVDDGYMSSLDYCLRALCRIVEEWEADDECESIVDHIGMLYVCFHPHGEAFIRSQIKSVVQTMIPMNKLLLAALEKNV